MSSINVILRDGSKQEFNKNKIYNALLKAYMSVGKKDISDINIILSKIIDNINDNIHIEHIQDLVEQELMNAQHYDIAKEYILYRKMREQKRSHEGFDIEKYIKNNIPEYPIKVPWNTLSYVVYKRTYSRALTSSSGTNETEEIHDTIIRILKACQSQLNINFTKEEILDIYKYMMNLKFLVAGRFLWQLGTPVINRLGLASLQNCAFVIIDSPIKPFLWIFDMLMLGCGVGFNIQKHNISKLPPILDVNIKIVRDDRNDSDFIIPDSRQGWVSLLEKVLEAYYIKGKGFTYSTILIRSKGSPINGFGGVASGPDDLCAGITNIQTILQSRHGKQLRSIDILDIICIIATIVVSGNVRRSATICLGDYDDIDYLKAKRWDLGNIPNWRSMSNNSVVCDDITKLPNEFWEGYNGNGEPYGLINLELSRKLGRLKDVDENGNGIYPDPEISGYNPCLTDDTNILTKQGLKTIRELIGVPFDAIVNGCTCPSSEKGFWKTGTKSVKKIILENGITIKATDNHRFLTPDGWIFVKDIHQGTQLLLNNGYYNIDNPSSSVIAIELQPDPVDVYDCEIPRMHRFVANGIISHNCAEQGLANYETCCLSEIFLPHIESYEEFKKVISYAYRICKHSLLLPCHHDSTEKIVHKNLRIGIGVTGYMQSSSKQKSWLSSIYEWLREYDKTYSNSLNINPSIKLTTVKPSGTLSLLGNVTAGCHPAIYPYYIRRMRISTINPLVELCRKNGYTIEHQIGFDGTIDYNTSIINFPCKYPSNSVFAKDITAIDQLNVIKELQTNWSDNSVSCTIYYKREEIDNIKEWLKQNYTNCIKSCSFLLHNDHKFKQAPYEEITEEQYNKMINNLKELTHITIEDDEIDYSCECSSGVCPIK